MSTVPFDTLKFADTLKQAGVPPAQAEAEARAIATAIGEVGSFKFRVGRFLAILALRAPSTPTPNPAPRRGSPLRRTGSGGRRHKAFPAPSP